MKPRPKLMAAVAITVILVTCGPYEKPASKDGELKEALFTIGSAIADFERAKGGWATVAAGFDFGRILKRDPDRSAHGF